MRSIRVWLVAWATVLAGAATVLAAEEPRLNVYNWNDYIAHDTVANFQRATGIAVRYDLYDSNATLQGKLLTGRTGYDVVYPSVEYAGKQIQAGIFQPLDKERLPNLRHLDPIILKAVEAADPGNASSCPTCGTRRVWRSTSTRSARRSVASSPTMPGPCCSTPRSPPGSAGCGIALMDEASDVIPAAMIHAGSDPTKMGPGRHPRRAGAHPPVRGTSAPSTPRRSTSWPRAACAWR